MISRLFNHHRQLLASLPIVLSAGTANASECTPGVVANIGGDYRSLHASGDLLFGLQGSRSLVIYDVTDGQHPFLLSTTQLPGSHLSSRSRDQLTLRGNYLFAARGEGGVAIVDVSDPLSTEVVSTMSSGASVESVAAVGDVLYTIGTLGTYPEADIRLQSFNVSDVESPALIEEHVIGEGFSPYYDLVANDSVVGTLTLRGFNLFERDVLNLNAVWADTSLGSFTTLSIDLNMNRLAAVRAEDIVLYDVADPAKPAVEASLVDVHGVRQVVLDTDTMYTIDNNDELSLYDISDPGLPVSIASVELVRTPNVFAVHGVNAYVSADGLRTIDLTDPLDPMVSEAGVFLAFLGAVTMNESVALAAERDPGRLHVFDVTSFDNPAPIAILDLPTESPSDLVLRDDLVFIAGGEDAGLLIVNIADPYEPIIEATLPFAGFSDSCALSGDILALGQSRHGSGEDRPPIGLRFIDVSDPTAPTLLATHWDTTRAEAMQFEGAKLYVTSYDKFRVFDVSDPAEPVLLGISPGIGGGGVHDITVVGDVAFTAHGVWRDGFVARWDVSDPTSMAWNEFYSFSSAGIRSVNVQGSLIYAATDDGRLELLRQTEDELIRLYSSVELGSFAAYMDMIDDRLLVASGRNGVQWVKLEQCEARGDTDGDLVVDMFDLANVLAAWGSEGDRPEDLNDDGVVDEGDLAFVLAFWH